MGVDVAAASPAARTLFERANAVLGYDLLALQRIGPEEKLRETEYSQPAIFTTNLALYEAVGGIGFVVNADVERVSAEIGYWLAEPFWRRGITTEALMATTRYAAEAHGLTRIYALPFAWNQGSCRVLEKAGYVLEARLRRSAIKDGCITDQLQYAFNP